MFASAMAATALAEFARRRPDHPATPALLRDALACAAVDAKESTDESINAERSRGSRDAAIATFLVDALDAFVVAPASVSTNDDAMDAAATLCEIAHDVAANAANAEVSGAGLLLRAALDPNDAALGPWPTGRDAALDRAVRGRDGRAPDAHRQRNREARTGTGRGLTCLTCPTWLTSPTRSVWRRR